MNNMTPNETKLSIIAEDLTDRLALCDGILNLASQILGRLDVASEAYNKALYNLATNSIVRHQLMFLKNFVDSGKAKMTKNCIGFILYQLEESTNKDDLIKDDLTGDVILDSKNTIYRIFKTYLKTFED